MSFIEEIKKRAKSDIKTIVLPEANDIRILEATDKILSESLAKIILIGNKDEILKMASKNNLNINDALIIEPENSSDYEEYVNNFYELRKHKGITIEQAKELILNPVYFGMMMVKENKADGLVSGAAHSTADTLRPALQILKTAPRNKNSIYNIYNGCSKL
jgi:phosphate acetyltransferase